MFVKMNYMKKLILLSFFIITVGFGQQKFAKLTYVVGDVMVHLPKNPSAEVAKWNMLLPDGSLIMTGEESRAEVRMPDGSLIRITEKSHLKISKSSYENQKRTYLFDLIKGGIFGSIKKLIFGNVAVKSPVAVIAVRGTEFGVWNVDEKTDEVSVLEGKVEVFDRNMNQSTMLLSGKKLNIMDGKPLGMPVPLSNMERKYLENLSNEKFFKTGEAVAPQKDIIDETLEKETQQREAEDAARITPPVTPISPPQKPSQPEQEYSSSSKSEGLQMGGGIGAVTMDGQTYTQLAFRPELNLGKLGIVFDITLYMDQDGKIRKENWDEVSDILEKVYYVRWAHRGDPFYIKVGAIDNYTMGFGLLMNRYSNTIEYPNVIRTGMELGIRKGKWYFEGIVNNFRELSTPGGVVGFKTSYQLPFGLEIGGMVVSDLNQYAGLKDADGDGAPDVLDDFPTDKKYQVDTDGDGVPDAFDPDQDGDGYTDNSQIPGIANNDPDGTVLKPDPFNIKDERNSVLGWGFNLAFPLVRNEMFSLIPYAEIAGIANYGYGFSAPGIMGHLAFLKYKAEYRQTTKEFIPEYFNQTYEIDRVRMITDTSGTLIPQTKKELLPSVTDPLKGWLAGTGFRLFNMLDFYAEYQNMKKSDQKFSSLRAEATINTSFIPKIKQATAYYNQYNVKEIFKPSDGTILGYKVMYEISPGAFFLVDYRQTYRDLNGDGSYKGSDEIQKTFNVGTYFNF
ncbi:MAG: hypothetical protein Kow00108_13190 [Calditrichia bacterium]